MTYTQIHTQRQLDNKVAKITLNQPESFNSLTAVMLKELKDAITEFENDESVRCIVLTGSGKAFCAGQNLKEALSFGDIKKDKTVQKFVEEAYNPLVAKIADCKKPIISLVNGAAVGAGAMLALICDICLATESAYFSQAFANIGLIPDTGGTYWLPKLLGRQQANYLAFTGRKLSASDAKNAGIIADAFPDSEFEMQAQKVIEMIANQPTRALELTKKAFNQSYGNSLENQLILEGQLQQEASETEDFNEGVTAFVQKRQPIYKGK